MARLNVDQSRLRVLQGLATIIILAAIGMFFIDGRPIFESLVGGATMGGIAFILTALILLAYWGLKSSFTNTGE